MKVILRFWILFQGINEVEKLLLQYEICIAQSAKLLKDSGVPDEAYYDQIVYSLSMARNAKGTLDS